MNFFQSEFYGLFAAISIVTLVTVVILRRNSESTVTSSSCRSPLSPAHEWLARLLGGLWVLDGLLQTQPSMIDHFANNILNPLVSAEPIFLKVIVIWGIKLWSLNPVLWDEFATWIQIGIGLAILLGRSGRTRRMGLYLSLVWGLVVWISGEALGSIFVHGSWLVGSPGSAFLYALAAISLLQPARFWISGRARRAFQWFFAALWFLSAFLQVLPSSGWWNPSTLSAYVESMAEMAQPGFLSAPLYIWAHMLNIHPLLWNAVLTMVFTALGVLWLAKPRAPMTWWLTVFVAVATWWLGQDFGVLGGMGTDPNSGAIVLGGLIAYARLVPGMVWQQDHSSKSQHKTMLSG